MTLVGDEFVRWVCYKDTAGFRVADRQLPCLVCGFSHYHEGMKSFVWPWSYSDWRCLTSAVKECNAEFSKHAKDQTFDCSKGSWGSSRFSLCTDITLSSSSPVSALASIKGQCKVHHLFVLFPGTDPRNCETRLVCVHPCWLPLVPVPARDLRRGQCFPYYLCPSLSVSRHHFASTSHFRHSFLVSLSFFFFICYTVVLPISPLHENLYALLCNQPVS